MKNYYNNFLLAIANLLFSNCFSQTYCENFDGFTVPQGNKQHAFNVYGNGNSGFLQDWFVASGTPSIQASGDLTGVDAYDGSQYALFGVCDVGSLWSESMELQYSFEQNKSYTVSFAIRNAPVGSSQPTPIDVDFVLLSSPIAYTYNSGTGCSSTPAVPGNAVTLHSITNFAQNSWSVISFSTGVLTSNYSHLWFRPKFSAGSSLITTACLLDSLCITPEIQTYCENFDGFTVPQGNKQHAFNVYGNGNSGFLQDWFVASGTPSIQASGDLTGVDAYDGSQYALFGVCDVGFLWSESMELQYSFEQNKSYTVSFAIRNAPVGSSQPTPIDVDFVLLSSPIAYTYNSGTGCSSTPAVPGNAVTLHSITNFAQNSWSVISFSTGVLTSNYSHLWFRPKFSAGSSLITTACLLDSLCISGDVSTGITAINSQTEITAFPNPATSQLTINLGGLQAEAVSIYNIDGKLMSETNLNNSIDISNLAKGVYIAHIKVRDVVKRIRWVKM